MSSSPNIFKEETLECFPNQSDDSSQSSGSTDEEDRSSLIDGKYVAEKAKNRKLFYINPVQYCNGNMSHNTDGMLPGSSTNIKEESVTEKSSDTSEDRKRKHMDECKYTPGNSEDQSYTVPYKKKKKFGSEPDNFYIQERTPSNWERQRSPVITNRSVKSEDNMQCVGSQPTNIIKQECADAVRLTKTSASTVSMTPKEEEDEKPAVKFCNDESKPSCSKIAIKRDPSEERCNTVVKIEQELSSPSCSKSSSSLEFPSRIDEEKMEKQSRKEPDVNLSTKEKESEKYSNSPEKSDQTKNPKTQENKRLQNKRLVEFDKLIDIVLSNIHLKKMLSEEELKKIFNFKSMKSDKKYLLLMFYTLSNHWHNKYEFCRKVQFDADAEDILQMFEQLNEEGLVDFVDYNNPHYDLGDLLQSLSRRQLKSLKNKLPIRTRPNQRLRLSDLVTTIVERFSGTKELKILALEAIQEFLGEAAKLSQSTYDALNYVYVLASFANPEFSDINKYFEYVIDEDGVFPNVSIEDRVVFHSRAEFTEYVSAVQLQLKLNCNANNIEITTIAEKAHKKLTANQQQDADRSFPHIQQFTSNQVYCSILSKCCESLFESGNYQNDKLLDWLNFLFNQFRRSRQIGLWTNQIIEIYKKKNQEENAVQLLIEVLSDKTNFYCKITDFYRLGKIGRSLAAYAKQQGRTSNHDRIIRLISRIDITQFKRSYIDLPDGRREFQIRDAILSHYSKEDYPTHVTAGPVLKALLVLYFWDIIYEPKEVVPATFISKLQSTPLDMYTFDSTKNCSRFYGEREKVINQRIGEIEENWPEDSFVEFGKSNYQKHSHELSAAGVIAKIIKDVDTIQALGSILGKSILAKIFARLITDLDQYEEGMPEFLFWNIDERTYKFVVGTTLDSLEKLPIPESVWLDYLAKNEINFEVCMVRGGGTKKKLKEQSSDRTETNNS